MVPGRDTAMALRAASGRLRFSRLHGKKKHWSKDGRPLTSVAEEEV